MATDPKWFVWCNKNDLREGDIVSHNDIYYLVAMIFFGQEETLQVAQVYPRTDPPLRQSYLYPAEGLDKGVLVQWRRPRLMEATDGND